MAASKRQIRYPDYMKDYEPTFAAFRQRKKHEWRAVRAAMETYRCGSAFAAGYPTFGRIMQLASEMTKLMNRRWTMTRDSDDK